MRKTLSCFTPFAAVAALCCCSAVLSDDSAGPKDAAENRIVLAAGEQQPKNHLKASVYLPYEKLPAGSSCRVAVVLEVESGWHINTNPARPEFAPATTVALTSKLGTKLGKLDFPGGRELRIEGLDVPQSVYEGRVTVFGTLQVPSDAAGKAEEMAIEVKFQACNSQACLPVKTTKLTGKVQVSGQGEALKTVNQEVFKADKKDSKEKRTI